MEFDSLIVALQNGQIDAVIAGMTVTEESRIFFGLKSRRVLHDLKTRVIAYIFLSRRGVNHDYIGNSPAYSSSQSETRKVICEANYFFMV